MPLPMHPNEPRGSHFPIPPARHPLVGSQILDEHQNPLCKLRRLRLVWPSAPEQPAVVKQIP